MRLQGDTKLPQQGTSLRGTSAFLWRGHTSTRRGPTRHRKAAAQIRSWLTQAHCGCREGGRASREIIPGQPEEPGGCSSVIQPIMTLSLYDLICLLGQLSNPLPRWILWAGKGAGAASPLLLSLSLPRVKAV